MLERAGGNPLYAEQFVELYTEQGSTGELALPETLQGIIAARLDGLPESEKGLLQDAAVVGKVFWASSIGRDPDAATASLHALERKGFVRRQRRSSLEGESEFAFAHALVRDVSTARSPAPTARTGTAPSPNGSTASADRRITRRCSRTTGVPRSSSCGLPEGTTTRSSSGLGWLCARPETGHSLSTAMRSRRRSTTTRSHSGRTTPNAPISCFGLPSRSTVHTTARREDALEAARDALLAVGDTERASEAESFLARVFWERGEHDVVLGHLTRAEALAGDSISVATARVLAFSGRIREIAGETDEGRRLAEAAFAMASDLGLDELRAHALTTIGMAKNDSNSVRACQTSSALSRSPSQPTRRSQDPSSTTSASTRRMRSTFGRTDEYYAESQRISERGMGMPRACDSSVATASGSITCSGVGIKHLESADAFIAECEAGSPHTLEEFTREVRAAISLARGNPRAGALRDQLRALELARAKHDPSAPARHPHRHRGDVRRDRTFR